MRRSGVRGRVGAPGSRGLCAGDVVRVRSKEEILATLDRRSRLEELPFMPEMFEYCGRTLRVYKRAHKTCDFVTRTGLRKLSDTVHLEDVRCSGQAHGGCQAACLIFWKEAWLERVPRETSSPSRVKGLRRVAGTGTRPGSRCTEGDVLAGTRMPAGAPDEGEITYICQATMVPQYTSPLSSWDVRQYIADYSSGNVRSLKVMCVAFAYRVYDGVMNLGLGYGEGLRWLYDQFRWLRGGRLYPGRTGTIPAGEKTPVCELGVRPGDRVRVKDHGAILKTVNSNCMNRGMMFGAEMVPYCGETYRVRSLVNRLIDERNGKMLTMKTTGVILEGVVCQARYNKGTLFCPRATFPYWREVWLERADTEPQQGWASEGRAGEKLSDVN